MTLTSDDIVNPPTECPTCDGSLKIFGFVADKKKKSIRYKEGHQHHYNHETAIYVCRNNHWLLKHFYPECHCGWSFPMAPPAMELVKPLKELPHSFFEQWVMSKKHTKYAMAFICLAKASLYAEHVHIILEPLYAPSFIEQLAETTFAIAMTTKLIYSENNEKLLAVAFSEAFFTTKEQPEIFMDAKIAMTQSIEEVLK